VFAFLFLRLASVCIYYHASTIVSFSEDSFTSMVVKRCYSRRVQVKNHQIALMWEHLLKIEKTWSPSHDRTLGRGTEFDA
jgi:hypothetical protein